MTTPLRQLLDKYRKLAPTERDKGTYLEKLSVVFLKNDATMQGQFEDAWLYTDWAKLQGFGGKDIGIDVVAKVRDSNRFCAIQCKFYADGAVIQKSDTDSFFANANQDCFERTMFIDTTNKKWSSNAIEQAEKQEKPCTIIGIPQLEASNIDWSKFNWEETAETIAKKDPRPHQVDALAAVKKGLITDGQDRGKVIMACGTGKTFTGLQFAEDADLAGVGKRVLFLVPSLALMSQTIREWYNDARIPLRSFAVCSDSEVGKRQNSKEDIAGSAKLDLEIPATTNYVKIASEAKPDAPDKLTVIFSTYQSIEAISKAQNIEGLQEFDLIICDEAHRTTGAKLDDEDESDFVKVHDNYFIKGKKRIYMTATPRVYSADVKSTAKEVNATVYSMDDEEKFGRDLFVRGFGWAVENKLLTDYKVLVLAIDEGVVSASVQNRLKESEHELKLDDATKIIGCYKALTKAGIKDDLGNDPHPMTRALAFCKDIASSKMVADEFGKVVNEYLTSELGSENLADAEQLDCQLNHVDGTMGAKDRGKFLDWLKEDTQNKCRILTNAKCLSEGVDVPALDAIMFMHPRKSQIDVVQSVGRVMRRAEGKQMGYVIIPVGIPAGIEPDKALDDNARYKVVWQILNALRSHDERLEAKLNQGALGEDISSHIEVIAISNQLPTKAETKEKNMDLGGGSAKNDEDKTKEPKEKTQEQLKLALDEVTKAILAKIVKKCGNRSYWSDWSSKLAKIAEAYITRITALVEKEGSQEQKTFNEFLVEIRDDLNETISRDDAIEMLAQHMITKPVFDALFEGYDFAHRNPVSKAMESVLDVLFANNLETESSELNGFYESVRKNVAGVKDGKVKQDIIRELYDNFFKVGFKRLQQKLGIVYTPVEVVDFIIHSVNDALQNEFGQTLGSKGVHILDPFTGTGTFITRLLQSGLIKPEELEHKFKNEIHANEIVLLAYYIAAINIEAAYHSIQGGDYTPFEGICLTDTFQLYEQDKDMISELMTDNSSRRTRQKELDIRVIMGNPPYSAGQKSANDDAANIDYLNLDNRIEQSYAMHSKSSNKQNLYDSYVRAIRWASDKIGSSGVIAYVTGSAWLERAFADGLRKCLKDEFSNIYIVQLRGDVRKNVLSNGKAGEGENIFGQGSMTGISIAILTKNFDGQSHGNIYSFDIGKNKKRSEKLDTINKLKSINGIFAADLWRKIEPDEFNDWFDKRDLSFDKHVSIGDKKDPKSIVLFENYSLGINSNRDAWCFNFSKSKVRANMQKTIGVYNDEVRRLVDKPSEMKLEEFIEKDPTKISWSSSLIPNLTRGKIGVYDQNSLVVSMFRPFQKTWLYYDKMFNHRTGQFPKIFPTDKFENLAICLSGVGTRSEFAVMMVNSIANLHVVENGQNFPLYLYDAPEDGGLFESSSEYKRRDAITNDGLKHFQDTYKGETITKEDIFYYIYGLLHSEDYRTRFADNLSKQLPRIPCVKSANDFWCFVSAGRALGEMHVNFETYEPFPIEIKQGSLDLAVIDDEKKYFRVEKMKYGGKIGDKDKSTIIYNSNITIQNIPLEAYDYVVNGKPAIDWVVERQCVKTDKDSGIVNDANDYANETMNNPRYPLELLARVINISLRTMKIVRNLPKLDI